MRSTRQTPGDKKFEELPLRPDRRKPKLPAPSVSSASAPSPSPSPSPSVMSPFRLNINNEYLFSFGFEWEPSAIHYVSSDNDNDYDRKPIYTYDPQNIKTVITIEKFTNEFKTCRQITKPCLYNLEIATGVFIYKNPIITDNLDTKLTIHMMNFKKLWDNVLQTNKGKKFVTYIKPSQQETLKIPKLYVDCECQTLSLTNCGYTSKITDKILNTMEGIPQLTVSIPFDRVYDFMNSVEYYKNARGLPASRNFISTINNFKTFIKTYLTQSENIDKTILSFLYVLHHYCVCEAHYDRYIFFNNYLKSMFTFKPRTNLGVSYQYICKQHPEITPLLLDLYHKMHQTQFLKIDETSRAELISDFDLIKDEESLMYFRIKFLAYCDHIIFTSDDEIKLRSKKLDHAEYCYFFRKYFNIHFYGTEFKNSESQEEYIDKNRMSKNFLYTDPDVIYINILYMLRQLVVPEYFRFVTRVDEFDRSKIDSKSPILNSYLYNNSSTELEKYIENGYIKKCTTMIPYCHTEDAPLLYEEDNKLCADYRLEIFEWVPQNSNFVFEIRDIQTFEYFFGSCYNIKCLDKLIIHVVKKIIEYANIR